MCGIIAIVRRRAQRPIPDPSWVRAFVDQIPEGIPKDFHEIQVLIESLSTLERETSGVPGTITFLENPELVTSLIEKSRKIESALRGFESSLNNTDSPLEGVEVVNSSIVQIKDLIWTLRNDRARLVDSVRELCQGKMNEGSVETFTSIHEALSALDRLEVRGRDSAGLHLMIRDLSLIHI